MGLTLYYELGRKTESIDESRDIVERLRAKSLTLPFAKVSELQFVDVEETKELISEVKRVNHGGAAAFLASASCHIENEALQAELGDDDYRTVDPECFFRFHIYPGEGCETAAIGLSRMPATTVINGREWSTGLSHWHWHSFCKTQYASNPKYGGIEHFLRCHLGLVELLDYADELDALVRVGDDSDFWEHRDVDKLRDSLTKMNRILASFTGAVKDSIGKHAGRMIAPITDFPNFEHLEAEQNQQETSDKSTNHHLKIFECDADDDLDELPGT